MKQSFTINEITAPITGWPKSGTYVPCPGQWVDLDVKITLPDGKEITDYVRGKTATLRPVKKLAMSAL